MGLCIKEGAGYQSGYDAGYKSASISDTLGSGKLVSVGNTPRTISQEGLYYAVLGIYADGSNVTKKFYKNGTSCATTALTKYEAHYDTATGTVVWSEYVHAIVLLEHCNVGDFINCDTATTLYRVRTSNE